MRVSGRATIDAPRDDVFAAICDPGALLEVIPGCDEIRRVSDTEYRGRLALRLPAIAGAFETSVRLTESDPPAFGAFEGGIEGRPGSVVGRASFRLTETDGRTVVDYEGDGQVGGPLARLDSRFLEGIATRLVDEGLARLGRRLARAAESLVKIAP
jgi:carbon monoxide dehydrogenase subunit G